MKGTMLLKVRWLTLIVLTSLLTVGSGWSQSAETATVLSAAEAAKLLPPSVFFRGQSAPIQARNSGGIKFSDGMYVLVALVDSSGYSTAVQQKYQAYLIAETAIEINGHTLPPGAYGAGFLAAQFNVMDIGNHDLFAVSATRDAALKRPTPLQVIADGAGKYRLYAGRDYVVISRPLR